MVMVVIQPHGILYGSLRIYVNFSLQLTTLQPLSQLLLGRVQIVHVGGVVLAMMQFHNLAGNDRFQGFVVVRQIGKRMLLTSGQAAHGPRSLPGVA